MNKPSLNYRLIIDIISVIMLSTIFLSPLFVADDLHDSTRMGSIFFGVQWIVYLIPVGIIAMLFNLRQPIGRQSVLVMLWFLWLLIRGKEGGIWHDTKFFWLTSCFVFYAIAVAILGRLKTEKRTQLFNIIVAIITSVAAIEAIMGILQIYGGFRIFHSQFKVTGTFFNPAPYAIFLVASLPWALFLSTHKKDSLWGKLYHWLGYITVSLIIVIVPSTQSRAAFIGAFSVGVIWLFYRYKPLLYIKNILNTSVKRKLAFSFVSIVAIVLISVLFLLKKDSASGRLLIWKMAYQSAMEQPLIGNGFNTIKATLVQTQADYFASGAGSASEELLAGNVPWAFNEPLQLFAETGVVGLIFFLLMVGYALLYPMQHKERDERLKLGAARASIVAIFIFSLFSYPFYFFPVVILLFWALAAVSDSYKSKVVAKLSYLSISSKLVLVAAGVVIAIFYSIHIPNLTKGYWTWDEAEKLYQIKEYNAALESYEEVYDVLRYDGLFLQQYGKCLAMDKRYQQSNKVLLEGGRYYRDEFWFVILGDNYRAIGDFDKAEAYYKQASFVVPHKFYPGYLLAKLYVESGQNEKARQQAKCLLTKIVKVESTAIKEIRDEMQKILDGEK